MNYLGNVNSILVSLGGLFQDRCYVYYNVNDINIHVDLGACKLYADDTLVYCSANTINELQELDRYPLRGIISVSDLYEI